MKIDWKKDISLPKLRKPSLPSRSSKATPNAPAPKPRGSKPKLSRPSLGGPDLRMPKLLTDLYADLRDRRLLPLVALLIVAIIAAPILLSGGGDKEETPAITPANVEGETKDAGLTVVPAEDGLRDYQRRLGHRGALNPFRQPPELETSTGESSSSTSSNSGGESESESSPEQTSSSGSEVVTKTVGGVTTEVPVSSTNPSPQEQPHHKSSKSESSGSESTEGSESAEATPAEPTPSTPAEPAKPAEPAHTETATSESPSQEPGPGVIVGYTIDAEAGFVPKTIEKTGIAPMTKLPNKKHPLVLFMGLSKDHKRALFLMTSNVTAYYGGHCALDKQACQLVEVRPGKGVTFVAGYGESRYKLHVNRIVPVRKSAP
jgi:hypothetical protein